MRGGVGEVRGEVREDCEVGGGGAGGRRGRRRYEGKVCGGGNGEALCEVEGVAEDGFGGCNGVGAGCGVWCSWGRVRVC